jgi:hypothetical protein
MGKCRRKCDTHGYESRSYFPQAGYGNCRPFGRRSSRLLRGRLTRWNSRDASVLLGRELIGRRNRFPFSPTSSISQRSRHFGMDMRLVPRTFIGRARRVQDLTTHSATNAITGCIIITVPAANQLHTSARNERLPRYYSGREAGFKFPRAHVGTRTRLSRNNSRVSGYRKEYALIARINGFTRRERDEAESIHAGREAYVILHREDSPRRQGTVSVILADRASRRGARKRRSRHVRARISSPRRTQHSPRTGMLREIACPHAGVRGTGCPVSGGVSVTSLRSGTSGTSCGLRAAAEFRSTDVR